MRAHEVSEAQKGVWECQPVWAHKTWWGSERLAGLWKDGSWGTFQAQGQAVRSTGRWKGNSSPVAQLSDQAGVEAWLALLEVARA